VENIHSLDITLLSPRQRRTIIPINIYVTHQKYGETSEHRNLNLYYISTPENLANLEQIRLQNLASIGMAPKTSNKIGDKKNATGNSYSVEVGETTETFAAHFNIDNFKFIPGSYKVELSSKRISRFSNGDLTYVVSMEADSAF
jgi:hypothetical protein